MNTVKYNTLSANPETEACELKNHIGETIRLHGAVYKIRRMSGFAFVLIRMRDAIVQSVYSEKFASFPLNLLAEEACVRLTAQVVAEERSRTGYELRLMEAQVLSAPCEELPIVINQKKVNTSLENLLDYRPVTLRNEKERAIFRIQAAICTAFREFLNREHFTEIHSPKSAEQQIKT